MKMNIASTFAAACILLPALGAAPALAQTTDGGPVGTTPGAAVPSEMGQPSGDFAGQAESIPLYRFPLSEETQARIRERQGDEQTTLELVQTTLLNRFGEMGFSRLIDIDKLGESYFALVETPAGAEALVRIDPLPQTDAVGAVENYPAEQKQ